jgi:hypothetical protein
MLSDPAFEQFAKDLNEDLAKAKRMPGDAERQ